MVQSFGSDNNQNPLDNRRRQGYVWVSTKARQPVLKMPMFFSCCIRCNVSYFRQLRVWYRVLMWLDGARSRSFFLAEQKIWSRIGGIPRRASVGRSFSLAYSKRDSQDFNSRLHLTGSICSGLHSMDWRRVPQGRESRPLGEKRRPQTLPRPL